MAQNSYRRPKAKQLKRLITFPIGIANKDRIPPPQDQRQQGDDGRQ
jgi:hypothetical protein